MQNPNNAGISTNGKEGMKGSSSVGWGLTALDDSSHVGGKEEKGIEQEAG